MDRHARFQASFYISLNQMGGEFCSMPTESSLSPSSVPEPPVNQMSPWMSIGAFESQIQSSKDIKIAIQDHSKWYLGVNSHPKNGLRLFKSIVSSCCGAPAEETLHSQSHSFMHSFIHISYSPQLGGSPMKNGEKPFIIHAAPCGQMACIQLGVAWFHKGIIYDTLLLHQCHATFGMIISTLAWVDQSHYPVCNTVIP